MDTNSRIIRDDRDETQVFDDPSRPTPRIDLILGVALAIVAGAIGVLGSLGLGAAAPTELMRPNAQVALADTPELAADALEPIDAEPAPLAFAPIIVAAPDARTEDFVFETTDAPAIVRTPDDEASRARIERALACLDQVRREADEQGKVDHRTVIRFLGAATAAAMDDSEIDATIDDVTVTIESLIEQMETPQMTDPSWTARSRDARLRAVRGPVRSLGL